MYRAAFPSQWILTHVTNHDKSNPSSPNTSFPPPPPHPQMHAGFALPAYYAGCMEMVPLVAIDQRKHLSATNPLSLDILGLENTVWNNRGVVMSRVRHPNRPNHYKYSNSSQDSRIHKAPKSKQNSNTNEEDVVYIETKSTTTTTTPESTQNVESRTPGSSSVALNNKGIKRRLDVSQKNLDRSSSPSSKSEGDVVYIATKRKPQLVPNPTPFENGVKEKGDTTGVLTNGENSSTAPKLTKSVDPNWSVPADLIKGNDWDNLSIQVWNKYTSSKQTDEMFNKKMRLHGVLIQIMQKHYPMCGLYVVGSSMTMFGTNSSDMDMCLMLTANDIDQRVHAINILKDVLEIIKGFDYFVKAELIRAKVPILEFRDSVSGVDVDLNVNNSVGIRNTHLLRAYSNLDWRVSPLVLVVKMWARVHDINDAKNMTISSYSLALMVIHFLQYGVSPPVLPSLQKLFPDVRELSLNEKFQVPPSKNMHSLGHLLWGFFHYYTSVFDFQEEAISVRRGGKVPKHFVKFNSSSKNNPGMWKCLCIEGHACTYVVIPMIGLYRITAIVIPFNAVFEPFDLTNTARAVYDEDVFRRIKNVFLTSYTKLNRTTNLSSIMYS